MGLLKSIELPRFDGEAVMQKFDLKGNVIKKGSVLTVRETQAAVFCDKGKTADVFLPGTYKLNTDSLPVITKLLSWKYGFETPFKSEIYFVNTKEFTGIKWGTSNPVPVSTEAGVVRLRGFGSYSFKITNPAAFLSSMGGTESYYALKQVCDSLRSLVVGGISTAFGACGVTLANMTSRYAELGAEVKNSVAPRCSELGITLTAFDIENLSVPPELEKALDENARLGIMRDNVDVYAKLAQADALKEAAKSGAAGAVMGVGIGVALGKEAAAGAGIAAGSPTPKFCPECGTKLAPGTKFCPECGNKLI